MPKMSRPESETSPHKSPTWGGVGASAARAMRVPEGVGVGGLLATVADLAVRAAGAHRGHGASVGSLLVQATSLAAEDVEGRGVGVYAAAGAVADAAVGRRAAVHTVRALVGLGVGVKGLVGGHGATAASHVVDLKGHGVAVARHVEELDGRCARDAAVGAPEGHGVNVEGLVRGHGVAVASQADAAAGLPATVVDKRGVTSVLCMSA